jgi:hypothetical protein
MPTRPSLAVYRRIWAVQELLEPARAYQALIQQTYPASQLNIYAQTDEPISKSHTTLH